MTAIRDDHDAEAFTGRMLGALNDAALVLLTSLGHRTGLFDAMAALPPATSDRIADHAGLHERYVREWLGGMVVGGVVEYEPEAETYSLPAAHAAALTRAVGPDNLAAVAAYIPVLADVEDEIAECFRAGGGVSYDGYPRFQEVMGEDSRATQDAMLLDTTLPLVPGLVDRLRAGIDVADVGCGSGHAANLIAQAFPQSRVVGYDVAGDGLARATAEANALGLPNARFELKDLATLDEPGRFGLVTAFDVIHDQAQPATVLRAIAGALAPHGTFLMVDFAASSRLEENVGHPLGPLLYTFSVFHCMTVSLAQGGAGLGTAWGEQKALEMLREAGFAEVDVRRVDGDPFNSYYIARR
jgi:SAM-dependent methyltransferase